jgi:hypothetical protein
MLLSPLCVAGLFLILNGRADATPANVYTFNNFALTNVNANGMDLVPLDGSTLALTGGNNGSGLDGTTDFSVTFGAPYAINFVWSYGSQDLPGFDRAGYLLGANFFPLADADGMSGTGNVAVVAGQTFGFRVETMDNTNEPGIFTVSSLSVTAGISTAPEPVSYKLVLTSFAILALWHSRSRMSKGALQRIGAQLNSGSKQS